MKKIISFLILTLFFSCKTEIKEKKEITEIIENRKDWKFIENLKNRNKIEVNELKLKKSIEVSS